MDDAMENPAMSGAAVHCEHLGRVFKIRGPKREGDAQQVVALDDVSLDIGRGELFGLLGPNGAGKTTLIKIMATLLLPTHGSAKVLGLDVVEESREIRRYISIVSGGETSGYGMLTVEENLWMFARFYGLESSVARQRIGELLDVVGIADRARSKISDLSTGLRQKMNFVRGFLCDPDVVFLDEPTLGLDVGAARDVRQYVKDWMAAHRDRTILLTTHYMAEADELCDRLAIIDSGRLLALDTPAALRRSLNQDVVFTLRVAPLAAPQGSKGMIEAVPGVRNASVAEREGHTELQLILDGDETLSDVLAHVTKRGSSLIALEKREPTLEDVFIDLVGRSLEVDTSGGVEASDG